MNNEDIAFQAGDEVECFKPDDKGRLKLGARYVLIGFDDEDGWLVCLLSNDRTAKDLMESLSCDFYMSDLALQNRMKVVGHHNY